LIKAKIAETRKFFLVSAIVLSLGLTVWVWHQASEPHPPHKSEGLSPFPIKIEKLLHTTYENNRLVAGIEAD